MDATALLQFVFTASDDFGLTQSNLVVALDGDLAQAERVKIGDLNSKKTRGAEELDLSLFDVQGGDRVAVFIECLDGRQPDPQIGRSSGLPHHRIDHDVHEELNLSGSALIEPFLTDLKIDWRIPCKSINEYTGRVKQTAPDPSGGHIDRRRDPPTPQEVRTLVKKALSPRLALFRQSSDRMAGETIAFTRFPPPFLAMSSRRRKRWSLHSRALSPDFRSRI